MKNPKVMLSWIFVLSLAACIQAAKSAPDELKQIAATMTATMTTPQNTPTLMATQVPDVVINARQNNQIVILSLGQLLKIEPPSLNIEWQVDFDSMLFKSITPPEMVRAPGIVGWLFRAVAIGDGQIVLTSIVSNSGAPRPPMPIRFQLVIQVK